MIKLYGLKLSNYYSLVKAALIEKELEFEEIKAPPSQEKESLARSPMGKMPSIEVDGQYLSESFAIVNYLEKRTPTPALLPADPMTAGKTLERSCHIMLNVELVARRCLYAALFGGSVSDEAKASTREDLPRGLQAVNQLMTYGPYAIGDQFTLADLYAYYSLGLAGTVYRKMFDANPLDDFPQMQALTSLLAERPSIARVTAESAS